MTIAYLNIAEWLDKPTQKPTNSQIILICGLLYSVPYMIKKISDYIVDY